MLSPYSALSLVRQRIHAVRQSTWLSGSVSHYFLWFPGDDFRVVSVFCAELGSTADACGASVYVAFWKNLTPFRGFREMTSCCLRIQR